ncbi:MAG TPA: cytochrome P450 [Thermoanaerobaculia bacterium]|nr:cytochrome P450 [Thermoanaerobaculia bacterium]
MIQETPLTTAPSTAELPEPRGGFKIPPGTDRLTGLREAIRAHGEIVCLSEEPRLFLIQHPDHVKHVLQDNQANYRQNTRKKILMGRQSLALSHGEPWRRRRRVLQPIFNQQRLAALAPGMVAGTGRMIEGWSGPAGRGEPVDVSREMIGLTLDLLIESLLGDGVDRGGLRRSVNTAFEYFNDRVRNPRTLPVSVPTPRNLRLLKALADLRRAVGRTVAEHQTDHQNRGEPAGNLLSMMIAARDEQTGEVMNPDQLLDELMMLLVMGHMTTAMAATWTWYMLSRHPEAEERVRAEIAEATGGRQPEFKDVQRLVYTRMVIEETMRLYPPSWSFSRFTLADDEIGGYRIPAGSVVSVTPWITHRRPDLWNDAERFDPERFAPGRNAERHRFAYYPFGGGPRVCIARDMALMELPLILATVMQRYRLRAVPGHLVAVVPGITLRPRAGLKMTLENPAAPRAARGSLPTLPELLLLAPSGDSPACLRKVDGRYLPVPRAELFDRARKLAQALAAMGAAPGEKLALLAGNGPDWVVADLGALAAGAVTVPLDAGLGAAEATRLVHASGARTVVASAGRLAELLARRGELPDVRAWIQLDGEPAAGAGEGVTSLRSLLQADRPQAPDFAALVRQRRPEDPATLLYTPGTAGEPKAVELTHANLAAAVHGLAEAVPVRPGDVAFSFLPLALPTERALLYLYLSRGATVAWAGSPDSVEQDLKQVQPHVFGSTPDFWKGFLNGLFQTVQANSPRRRQFFQWSVQAGRRSLPFKAQQRRPPAALAWKLALADRFVFSRIRARLGGRLRFALSGGDRIPHGWITLLWGAGIPVYESYGLTEAGGVVTVNTPRAVRPGTAGAPLSGVEVRIAGDGEILVRGGTVNQDDWLHTGGWLHTGDTGWFDDAGMLSVFGRQADLFAGLGGKKVSPGGLESLFRSSHFIAQAVMVGDGRPYNALLIAPDLEGVRRMARRRGIAYSSIEELLRDGRVKEHFAREVQGFNDKLAPHDQVRKWELLPRELSVAEGELTPAGTVRRGVVLARYTDVIERLYAG